MTVPEMLSTIGRALYGQQWQSDMARDLGVNNRTVRRWVAGESQPDGIMADLLALVERRGAQLDQAAKRLRRFLADRQG